ncbi:hypothetical protein PPERSA_00646 [Pseudocohnilembus persalinus]|uniref:Uncharacterized protein n=1 Tax=Pseudocohnilembus persalinus TaxID=266149 RepID=A0A0V0QT01_PSEPJ|nr:hypothetical protein PPERSA_00646 [Pseudocohnilembus persalinus]|eukprot:KRX05345.1 hypothetical protein PPERSA_00646 [Pseudocohnilembus persalinus]
MEEINYQQMKTDIINDEGFLCKDQNQKLKTQQEQQRSELNFKTEELTISYLQQIKHLIKFYNEINNTTQNDIQFLNITQTTNNKNKQINYPDLQFFLQLPKLLPQLKEISFETQFTLTELVQNNPNQYIQFQNNTDLLQNYLNFKNTQIQTQQTFKKTTLPQTYRKEILNEIALDYLNPAKLKQQLTNSQPQSQPQPQQIYHLVKDYKLNPENTKYSQNKKLDQQINDNLIPSSEIESAEKLGEGHIEQILTGLDLGTTVREVSEQIQFIFQGKFYKQKEEELESEISDEEIISFKPKKGEFIEYLIPNYEQQKIYNGKKYLKFDKDVILRNCAGFNTDSRGGNNCGIILDFHQEINLGKLINYQDLILGIFKLKSHKCENWYELFINRYRVTNNKYFYIIDLEFDHGS